MHSSAERLRLISRVIVIALVVLVGAIIVIHDHVSGSGRPTVTPTSTPAVRGTTSFDLTTIQLAESPLIISVTDTIPKGG